MTSSADIEPETSTMSAIDACSLGDRHADLGPRERGQRAGQREQRRAAAARSARQRRVPAATRGQHLDVRVVDRVAGAPPLEREVARAPRAARSAARAARAASRSSPRALRVHLHLGAHAGGQPAPRRADEHPARRGGRARRGRRRAAAAVGRLGGVEADAVACCAAGARRAGRRASRARACPARRRSVVTRVVIGWPGLTALTRE